MGTNADIQVLIDRVSQGRHLIANGDAAFGGVVRIPAGEYTLWQPLLLPPGVYLAGDATGTSLVCASGNPDAVLLTTNTEHGHYMNSGIGSLTIKGGRVRFDPKKRQGEAEAISLDNLIFRDSPADAVDLRMPNGGAVYQPVLSRLRFYNPGGAIVRGTLRMAELRQVKANNNAATAPGWDTRVNALIDIEGPGASGIIENCWLEGRWNCAFLRLFKGSWEWRQNWNEPGAFPTLHPQILLDGTELFAGRITAQSRYPMILSHGSTLHAHKLEATDETGAPVPLDRGFVCDGTSRAFAGGKQVAGPPQAV